MKKEREYIINNAYLMKEWDWEENKKEILTLQNLLREVGKNKLALSGRPSLGCIK